MSISKAVGAVDAERAEAFSASDKRRIDATIVSELGGFSVVNEMITKRMRAWLSATGVAALDKLRVVEGDAVADASPLMSNLTVLLEHVAVGSVSVAQIEKLKRISLKAVTAELETAKLADPDETSVLVRRLYMERASRLSNLSLTVSSTPDRLDEALELASEAFALTDTEIRYQVSTVGHVQSGTFHQQIMCLSNKAAVYFKMERWPEAEHCYCKCLSYSIKLWGDNAPDTELHRHNLASFLFKRPSTTVCTANHALTRCNTANPAACDVCNAQIDVGVEVYQCANDQCDYDCCQLCYDTADERRLAESVSLFRVVVANRVRASGEGHADTITSMEAFSHVLERQAETLRVGRLVNAQLQHDVWANDELALLDEAASLMTKSVLGYRKTFGPTFDRAIDAACRTVRMLVMMGKHVEAREFAAKYVLYGGGVSVAIESVQQRACYFAELDGPEFDEMTAAILFERVLRVCHAENGIKDPRAVISLANLLACLDAQPQESASTYAQRIRGEFQTDPSIEAAHAARASIVEAATSAPCIEPS